MCLRNALRLEFEYKIFFCSFYRFDMHDQYITFLCSLEQNGIILAGRCDFVIALCMYFEDGINKYDKTGLRICVGVSDSNYMICSRREFLKRKKTMNLS